MASKTPTIGNAQFKLLEKLCNASGVSGDEGEVRQIILEEVKPNADEVKVDALGNVLVTKQATTQKNKMRVMLDAHMDEVGFMIVADDNDGIYRFELVGGIDVRQIVGKQVIIGKENLSGVIGARPIHLTTAEERQRKIPLDQLRIDVGPGGAGKIKAGMRAAYVPNFKRVGPSIMSKAIDDRIGCATLIELLKHAPAQLDLCISFSVQEEIGLRGAKVAAHYFDPEVAFAIDSTPAHDLPTHDDSENTFYNTKLGQGPAIYIADAGTLSDPRLIRFLAATGDDKGIQYQFRQPGGGGTDGSAIHKQRAGIPTVSISVPHRYTHTACSLARVDDWKNTLALLYAALQRLTPDVLKEERR